MNDLKQVIRTEALRLGFSFCGFAKNEGLEEIRHFYTGFVKRNDHPSLEYLKTHFEKRLHPELVLEGTKTVIALLMNYFPREIIPEEDNYIIAKYAYGADYHVVLRNRMKELISGMRLYAEDLDARAFVDSGVVLEKAWAQKCGVGWQGKNTLIINKTSGSFFFIGIILTNLELEPDLPEPDHCSTCNRCISACPTGALNEPYRLDIIRCISYQTIENREDIPPDIRSRLGNRIYGCDICQDVCPYNRFAKPHQTTEFSPTDRLVTMRKKDWITMTETDFMQIFPDSPVKRVGYAKLKRGIL
jgi:epoxyqueuosine reductase